MTLSRFLSAMVLAATLGHVGKAAAACVKSYSDDSVCNSGLYVRDKDGLITSEDGKSLVAGECVDYGDGDHACKCTSPFSGEACDMIKRAGGPALYNEHIMVNSWAFIAKTCWGPRVSGIVSINLKWDRVKCDQWTCHTNNSKDWSSENQPNLLFYGSHDDSFDNAVQESYRAAYLDSPYLSECDGANALYTAPIRCQSTNGSCVWSASFGVINPDEQDMLIYLAVAGCGLKGLVEWQVEVENNAAANSGAYVCGSKGTFLEHRCFSEAGGTCNVQTWNSFGVDYRVPYRVSRTAMAVTCVVVLAILACGVAGLKYYQYRHKVIRSKELRGRIGLQKELGANGADEPTGDEAAYAPQGNGATQFVINGVSK